jgi:hypothetical protein
MENKVKDDEWTAYQKLPRYTVGLQKPTESNCYVDFDECTTLVEAKEKADKEAAEMGRIAIVYDRKEGIITYKTTAPATPIVPTVEPKVEDGRVELPKKSRGRPKRK